MKKALRETQTLRAGSSKAEPKNFAPPQTPFPGARNGQNLISWRWSLPSATNPVWWGSMRAILSYCGNRPTHTQTHTDPPTNRQDRLQYTAPQLARSVMMEMLVLPTGTLKMCKAPVISPCQNTNSFTGRMPFLYCPTNIVRALMEKIWKRTKQNKKEVTQNTAQSIRTCYDWQILFV